MSSLRSLLDHTNRLKLLPRTGWLLNGVQPCESVAEHTCAVALLALALAESINADWEAQGLRQPLEVGKVARLALIHDLAESVLTDLPKRSVELLGADVKHSAEARAMAGLFRDLPNGAAYVDLWGEYDSGRDHRGASRPRRRQTGDGASGFDL